MADRNDPKHFWVPQKKTCNDPEKMCICGHARMVMYISAEGRALPCMALSGMDIQEKFPLIQEIGLAKCLTDLFYMNFIDTRVSDFLAHNPDCAGCEHSMQCLGGCRAAGLENEPDDLLAPDRCTCEIFKGGWIPRIEAAAAASEAFQKRMCEAEK